MHKDLFIAGTRPEIIKYYPLLEKIQPFFVFTGQQKEMAREILDKFRIIPDIDLKCSPNDNESIAEYVSKLISSLDKVIKVKKPKRIWVMGDTSSAFAGAIVANLNKIELVHLESGLRTGDKNNPYPEESYRTIIDHLSDILFVPTMTAMRNLKLEGISGDCYLTGNTIVDALEEFKGKYGNFRPISEKYVLATVHRRESFGKDMIEIFKALKKLSKKIKVVLLSHSNPEVKRAIRKVGLESIEPMSYLTFLRYLEFCEYVLSDSGGIQEEAPSFNKKIIVLRKVTERPEIIKNGYGILIKKMESDLILEQIENFTKTKIDDMTNPFGDGRSSKLIKGIIAALDKKDER